jgi:hypothetical protein
MEQDLGGRDHPSWIAFLEGFGSKDAYKKRVDDFFQWQASVDGDDLVAKLIQYFKTQHDGGLAPTTLRSWFSMFVKFWLHSGRGDLKLLAPIIEDNLSKWEKNHSVKKSKTFTKEQLGK